MDCNGARCTSSLIIFVKLVIGARPFLNSTFILRVNYVLVKFHDGIFILRVNYILVKFHDDIFILRVNYILVKFHDGILDGCNTIAMTKTYEETDRHRTFCGLTTYL
eukprot:TRINITY_DN35131_c0_g1_i3.p1 TRINITY_DN35131_c0_g1~~TRINITY_DN35131_c0_g1_i3.p1  ORF type:complete len:107 (+),score=2.69 TRINITY_DN35131_c0_g1_i3:508-828(+)